mgnify:CR=1 FL=1
MHYERATSSLNAPYGGSVLSDCLFQRERHQALQVLIHLLALGAF